MGFLDADAAVRPAVPADAAAMGAVHARSWAGYPAVLTAGVGEAELVSAWRQAVSTPPSRGHQVLVATAGGVLVGFTAVSPDGEVVALHVDPAHQRQGHGSRLLAAAVETLRELGVGEVSVWVPSMDDARLAFFRSAGLTGHQEWREFEVDDDGITLRELRLVASLDLQ